jgi:hypothetical protein
MRAVCVTIVIIPETEGRACPRYDLEVEKDRLAGRLEREVRVLANGPVIPAQGDWPAHMSGGTD